MFASSAAAQSSLSPFMMTRGKTSQPIGHHDFCLRYSAECSIRSAKEARMKLTPERWNQLVVVNNDVNTTVKPATDEEVYGRQEYWAYPSGRGDCEDLVLLKRRLLEEKGWPVGSLLITVVVVMDFMAQLQAHLMSHQYEGLLKKANLKSLGNPGVVR